MAEHLYYLRTLSAEAVLDQLRAGAPAVDLSNPFTADAVISSTGRYGESAMLYQILRVRATENDALSALRADRNALRDMLFFVDFDGIFLSKDDKLKAEAEGLLRDELWVRFEKDANSLPFLAFDKSNSMSRAGRIAYLRADLAEMMHGRLMLDMQGFQANLSKVYAYRGLYFSDADRIDSAALELNERTVVVLPDDEDLIADADKHPIPKTVFKADPSGKDADGYDIWTPVTCDEEIKLNRFDGEGLISPDAARAINAALGPEADNTSFQIRLPFGKGMLHEVDFRAFFASLLPEGASADNLWVEDLYGHKRKLSDCRILLTKSMFKCHKWLKTHCDREKIDDPMKYYFDKMREYDHALYISNTDEMLRDPTGRVQMNYQFLNPLDLTEEDFTSLVEDHFKYAARLDRNQYYRLLEAGKTADADALDSWTADETHLRREKGAWIRAVHANRDFLSDQHVKMTLNSLRSAAERDCITGRLSVPGACRFLARDLLALLVFAAQKQLCLGEQPLSALAPDPIRAAQRECLEPDRFYLPGKTVKLWSKEHCVLLRNPHLARNEECLLRPLVPNDRYGTYYQRYFSRLTGVVMVPYDSLVPMALGGADFDGDLVKVIVDPRVAAAVRQGVYRREADTPPARLERALPVISIPSPGGDVTDVTDKIDVPTIRNTFSSRVGQISNMAIRIGKQEYGAEPVAALKNKCAECCILTGLEIDASKTGQHPSLLAMKNTQNEFCGKDRKDNFLDNKDRLQALKTYKKQWKINDETEGYLEIWANGGTFRVRKENTRLDQLELRYLQHVTAKPPKTEEEAPLFDKAARPPLFRFDLEEQPLNPEKKKAAKEILDAYSAVLSETKRLSKARQNYQKSKYHGRCRTIIRQQYGSLNDTMGDYFAEADETAAKETVEYVLLNVWGKLHDRFSGDADGADAALRLMEEKQWHFCAKDARQALLKEMGLDALLTQNEKRLLTRFDYNGYRLLFYMLKDARAVARREEATAVDEPEESGTGAGEAPVAGDGRLAEYRALVLPLIRANAETAVWKNELVDRCRNDLMRAVETLSMGDVLPYVYDCKIRGDRFRTVFWDLFRWDDLKDQIVTAEKKGATADAG